ncbi:uncharacterized protein BJ212DRAFT_1303730 [Suillus subaureus]|uniref:Uncharacterized protein n=1 Tax=Suillus subaureus TaxID=48587 RepID=A0A9P7J776_9AGAM|nr:uncharacterized protein BJ212DRAFT_1303730 [Suillus subaureus]KAG1806216.1 hypothetical protein BJ212DRAFT_1303730 [Suillus subaureus]
MLKESPGQGPPPQFHRQIPVTTPPGVPSVQHSTPALPQFISIEDSLIDPVLRSPVPPCHMVDADVMTNPPQCISDALQPLSPPNLDLISGILSVKVLQQSKMVTWADGCRTVLPCVMSKGINIYKDTDVAMVQFLSKFLESKPTSNNIQSISEALHHNKPVIIWGSGSDSAPALDVEYLETNFRILPLIHCYHTCKQVMDFAHSHMKGTIQQFLDDINNPSKIQYILNIPLSHVGLPPELHLLDHGLIYGWNKTTVDCPIESSKVHPDNFTTKSWILLHQAGFMSYPHHNADSAITFVQIKMGIKFWVVFHPKHVLSQTVLQKAQMLFANFARCRVFNLLAKALVGLCLMVINCDKYKALNNDQGYKIIESESTKRVVTIATVIIHHFYKDMATMQQSYQSSNQSDPEDVADGDINLGAIEHTISRVDLPCSLKLIIKCFGELVFHSVPSLDGAEIVVGVSE